MPIRPGACWAAALTLLAACGTSARPARYLYVWAGTGHDAGHPGTNFIAVLDVKPGSTSYGHILAASAVATGGVMPHHAEYALPEGRPFFANDFTTGRTFLIDPATPLTPRVRASVDRIPGFQRLHSFMRLEDTLVLATLQFGDSTTAGNPGGLAEFNAAGRLLRTASSRDSSFPGERIRTYGLTVLPRLGRALTTSAPMDNERTADVAQVWRLSDLALLKTIRVPGIAGDSVQYYPFEPRTLADGRTVFMNTYYCGFYRITGLDQAEPAIELVFSMRTPRRIGCSVPLSIGNYWLMPIAYAHTIVTLDVTDPEHPKEVSAFATDSTFFPHWIAADPGSDRLVVTEQGDGPPRVLMVRLNRSTGTLTWDEQFREADSARPGISFNRASWPNGIAGMAMPHAALFVP